MQDIYLDKVILNNVRAHDNTEMDFPVDSFDIITGRNGAGKSTIFKSVSMALYGDDGGKKGERLSLTDMLNCKNPKNLSIILFFRIVDGSVTDNYEIRLYQNHSKFKNALYLYKNGTDISGETKTHTYEMISSLLIPRDVYHNTVYFTQQVKDFFTALTNSEQKDIFDSIMSMKIYDVYYRNTCNVISGLDITLADLIRDISIKQNNRDMKANTKVQLCDSRDSLRRQYEVRNLELRDRKTALQDQIQIIQDELDGYKFDQSEFDSLTTKLAEVTAKINSIEQMQTREIESLRETHSSKERDIRQIQDAKKNEEVKKCSDAANELLSTLQKQKTELSQKLHEISKKYNTSSFEREIAEYTAEKQKEIKTLNEMIHALDVEFSTKSVESEKSSRISFFVEKLNECKDNANEIRSNAKNVKSNIDRLQSEISHDEQSLNQDVPICSKCHRPFIGGSDSDVIKVEIDKKKSKIEEYNQNIVELQNQMSKIKELNDDYILQRDKEVKEFDERIALILDKKNQKRSDLDRKLALIQQESHEHIISIKAKIADFERLESLETVKFDSQILAIERQEQDTIKTRDSELYDIRSKNTKELDCKIQEHNINCTGQIDTLRRKYETSKIVEVELKSKLENDKSRLTVRKNKHSEINQNLIRFNTQLSSIEDELKNQKDFVYDESQINRLDSEIQELEKALIDMDGRKRALEREISILNFWKAGFSDNGIKSMLIDMAIPHMNESVSECLEMVAPGVFTVTFDTLKATKSGELKDKFNVNIRHNIKGTDSHKKLSGGEKRLVDIACMYALRSLTEKLYGKKFHNSFYDEVLDALDEEVAAVFCQTLKSLARNNNVSLITHKIADYVEPDRRFSY